MDVEIDTRREQKETPFAVRERSELLEYGVLNALRYSIKLSLRCSETIDGSMGLSMNLDSAFEVEAKSKAHASPRPGRTLSPELGMNGAAY
jgi:hypothetical protein